MGTSTYSSGTMSTYSSILTTTSLVYCRTDCLSSEYYYYDAIQVDVSRAGIYLIESHSLIDIYGYIYEDSFNPSNPNWNLLSYDDDSGENRQFKLTIFLRNSTGTFTVNASGPKSVIFTGTSALGRGKHFKCSTVRKYLTMKASRVRAKFLLLNVKFKKLNFSIYKSGMLKVVFSIHQTIALMRWGDDQVAKDFVQVEVIFLLYYIRCGVCCRRGNIRIQSTYRYKQFS